MIERTKEYAGEKCEAIAGKGSHSAQETDRKPRPRPPHCIKTFSLVDPYYNGPSSIESARIRRAHRQTIPPDADNPYVSLENRQQLLPQDLAVLIINSILTYGQ